MRDPSRRRVRLRALAIVPCVALALACGQGPKPLSAAPTAATGGGFFAAGCAIPGDFVPADTVNITNGVCWPLCVLAPPGSPVRFVNHDAAPYTFVDTNDRNVVLEVPANGSVQIPPHDMGIVLNSFQLATDVVVYWRFPFGL